MVTHPGPVSETTVVSSRPARQRFRSITDVKALALTSRLRHRREPCLQQVSSKRLVIDVLARYSHWRAPL